jgi:signal transduction histidine kinase
MTFTETSGPPSLVRALRTERTMVRVRWVAVAFACLQVLTYYLPYPPGVLPVAFALVFVLAAGNVVAWAALRRTATVRGARQLQAGTLLLDGLVVMGLVVVYTFDVDTAMWAVIYILPLEGALKFGLRGSLTTMAAATVAYSLRELYGMAEYGNPFLATSVSFRMGIGFIIAWVAGAMASSLVRERDEVERSKAAVERSAEELELVVEQLREATAVKDDFLAVTNHELRTPLTTILGYGTTLQTKWHEVEESQRREFIDHMVHQARRLHALVEDLLTLSSAQAGALDVEVGVVQLCAAVEEALANNGLRATRVRNECARHLQVFADFERLTQVLTNFVSNALKYGAEPITITAGGDHEWVELRVTDEGPGVPEDFVPYLFEKFSQASRGVSRTAEGTGLGLAIVQQLTQAQGGEVWYEPNLPRGSQFCLRLPRATDAHVQRHAAQA